MMYIGFLRGINVGGHHKVPMAELRQKLIEVGCTEVKTLLNSGNFIFESKQSNSQKLEKKIEDTISSFFGFPIPVILRKQEEIRSLIKKDPFQKIKLHKDIRLYVSFLKDNPEAEVSIPYHTDDKSFTILMVKDRIILSVLDLSTSSTPKGMEVLEKIYGKNITTRNWNTVMKMAAMELNKK